MTNRVEALFLCRALVLMRLIWAERRRVVPFALFQTLLPTPSVTFIGIILSLASLWHWHYWSMVLCFSNGTLLPAECKLRQQKEVQFIGEHGASLRRAHGVYLACCIVVDRWRVRCPVLFKTLDVMLPTHSPTFPPSLSLSTPLFSSLKRPSGRAEVRLVLLVELRPVVLVLHSPRLTQC